MIMTQKPQVVITTAHKLTDSQKRAVLKEVKQKVGTGFELQEVVNPQVVGGLKINIGQKEFDVTVAGKLAKLKSQLPTATATSAIKLSPAQRQKINKMLEESYGPINFEEVVDESVVGGLKLRVGSAEYDGTIQTKLSKIQALLKQQF